MDFFFTTEFYIMAFLIAVAIAAFFFRPRRMVETKTYFASGSIIDGEPDDTQQVIFKQDDIGEITLIHTGVSLPEGAEASLQAIVDEDGGRIKFVEKTFPLLTDAPTKPRRIVYTLSFKALDRTHILFEAQGNSTMGTTTADITPPCRIAIEMSK